MSILFIVFLTLEIISFFVNYLQIRHVFKNIEGLVEEKRGSFIFWYWLYNWRISTKGVSAENLHRHL